MVATTDRPAPRRHADLGFSLIELLIVIVILGVLGAIVVFAVQDMSRSSASAGCESDFKSTELAEEAYKGQVGSPATSFLQLQNQTTGLNGDTVGPWLKEASGNTNSYIISFDTTPGSTYGNIQVASVNPWHAAQDGNANCAYA